MHNSILDIFIKLKDTYIIIISYEFSVFLVTEINLSQYNAVLNIFFILSKQLQFLLNKAKLLLMSYKI